MVARRRTELEQNIYGDSDCEEEHVLGYINTGRVPLTWRSQAQSSSSTSSLGSRACQEERDRALDVLPNVWHRMPRVRLPLPGASSGNGNALVFSTTYKSVAELYRIFNSIPKPKDYLAEIDARLSHAVTAERMAGKSESKAVAARSQSANASVPPVCASRSSSAASSSASVSLNAGTPISSASPSQSPSAEGTPTPASRSSTSGSTSTSADAMSVCEEDEDEADDGDAGPGDGGSVEGSEHSRESTSRQSSTGSSAAARAA